MNLTVKCYRNYLEKSNSNILQNFCFGFPWKKVSCTGLEQYGDE